MSSVEEYNTNVPDKDERLNTRRKRIEQRNIQLDPDSDASKVKEEEGDMKFRGQQQIATSLVHLDKKKASGIDDTTVIRVNADLRESRRRVKDEAQRQDRMKSLEAEARLSSESNVAIAARWSELDSLQVPQDLHKAIEEQKAKCASVLASKDALIAEFHLALKLKDEEYVKTLKKQADDIQELLARMRREFRELSDQYDVELESIEDAFLSERSELLRSNKAEIDAFFDARKQSEIDYAAKKSKREEEHQKEIEDQIVHDHEEYSKLKIKLETDIQTLEQQLEEMQATYQLNTEKLEYNYRVLTERDNENTQTLLQLKRKQSKLKETLSALQSKYNETENRDKKKNEELTESYRSITKQYKDLQAKFRHFELADNKRFDQLWAMHEEEVAACISKALTADELITTQQLGWEWEKPDLSTVRYGGGGGTVSKDGEGGEGGQLPPLLEEGGGGNGDNVDNQFAATAAVSNFNDAGQVEDSSEAEDSQQQLLLEQKKKQKEAELEENNRMIAGAKMQAMMLLLVEEAQFLVDNKVKAALNSMTQEEAQLAQAESMLKALGCENEADMQSLIDFFFPLPLSEENEEAEFGSSEDAKQGEDGGAAASGDGSSSVLPAAFKELARMIQPEDVVKAVSQFVDAKKAKRAIGASSNGITANSGVGTNGNNSTDIVAASTNNQLGNKAGNVSSLSAANEGGAGGGGGVHDARREEREYWVRASSIVSSSTISVWTQLELALGEYNEVLSQRQAAIEEVEDLQAKNGALKELLHTYLSAGVNDDLIVPPNQNIHLEGF